MNAPPAARLKIAVRGAVQGVGFRPFVYRLANELGLAGWVNNSLQGVFLEVEGRRADAEKFLLRLETEKPPRSSIQSLEASWLDPAGYANFEIRASQNNGSKTALVLPDIATCPDCLREIFDPGNRRHLYPFTNCTNCGPRFSIIESLPYDRANTSMKKFAMCPECQAEYNNPNNRRFHAQPNACPKCGPHLELWRSGVRQSAADPLVSGNQPCPHERGHEALLAAAAAIRRGQTVALKGIGGFQLIVDARNEKAIRRLRRRKHREEKPFALMYPTMELAEEHCEVNSQERRLLLSPESPIVLLRRRSDLSAIRNPQSAIAPSVAPGNPRLGVMLPYTPLHHLLMSELGFPVVATSGNLSDEPICTDEREALERLGDLADLFLVHNRPIARHVDDSMVQVLMGREQVLRRARGYAPLPIRFSRLLSPVLAVGSHLKNTIALATNKQIFISQHIGDLETVEAHTAFRHVIGDFERLYEIHPTIIACDLHPDYLSTQFAAKSARERPASLAPVQHHVAHIASCMAENELDGPVLGVSWDGTGYGTDGTVWGGEFLRVEQDRWERFAHFRTFPLPGGDAAAKEPRRAAIGLLYELLGSEAFALGELAPLRTFSPGGLKTLHAVLERKLNCPSTSSVGRLFDAVAALVGIRQRSKFEGQAAMELEFATEGVETTDLYDFAMEEMKPGASPAWVVDWGTMIKAILKDIRAGIPAPRIAATFHNTLVEIIVAVAYRAREDRIVLSGGCFQNRYLTEHAVRRLRDEGFHPYWHQRIPPNDGGIALGQAVVAAYPLRERK